MKVATNLLLLSAVLVLSLATAFAQPAATGAPPSSAQVQQQPPTQKQVTEYTLSPDKMAKAVALYRIRTTLYLFSLVFSVAVLWLLLKLRVAPKFRDIAERVSKYSFVQVMVFVPLFMLTTTLISLPIELYQHHISLKYGLSVQGWGSWAADVVKGQLVGWVISTLVVFVVFATIRWSPRRWWFFVWLEALPFLVLIVFVAPVILDPIFNKFEPLEKAQPQLVREIEKVTHRGGLSIPRSKMFEMKASEKVTTYNAYVTGLGATKRVVVWDNTSKDLTTPETLFVFGHEQGHYVLHHIYKGLAFASLMMLIGFWIGSKIVTALMERWGESWGIRALGDYAALPVLMLVLSLLTLVGEPIGNAFSRYLEHQADIYGLEVTHGLFANNGQVAASAFQKLGEKSYSYPTPSPVLVFWSYDHPPIPDRVKFSLSYDPWHGGGGPEFVR
jgi:Zn-dependent protease with chaperone function